LIAANERRKGRWGEKDPPSVVESYGQKMRGEIKKGNDAPTVGSTVQERKERREDALGAISRTAEHGEKRPVGGGEQKAQQTLFDAQARR